MDCTFLTEKGNFNFRVGAVIADGGRVLAVRNPNEQREFYYSVGGRVNYGETTEEAILRELYEETGIACEIDRLYAIHENFFTSDDGVPFHEISIFFLIKKNSDLLNIKSGQLTDQGPRGEYLVWIDLDHSEDMTLYPPFFRELDLSDRSVKHYITKE
ncbi:MAG: NUDIX domain-containing protein [Ruminococcus sp.]|nr:NUDIX domain-containing protein [Ruminococcus sp.]